MENKGILIILIYFFINNFKFYFYININIYKFFFYK